MTGSLTPQQVAHYWEHGYVNRLPILSPERAQELYDELVALEAAELERRGGVWQDRGYRPWDHDDHPFADLVQELARTPALLDAVESVLGPDLLVRNADIFTKSAGLRRGIGWHLDTAERGEDTDGMLTAWLGLTESTKENGGLWFSAGSHMVTVPGGPTDKYTLTLTREAAAHLDRTRTVYNVMEPGMASLHHFRMIHASGPNLTDARRVGFVVRFMRPSVSAETAESGQATLVRGKDTHGHFALKDRFPMTWSGG